MTPPAAAAPIRHPDAPNRSPDAVTMTAVGLAMAASMAVVDVVDAGGRRQQHVEQAADVGAVGRDVRAHRRTGGDAPGRRAGVEPEREDGAVGVGLAQRGEGGRRGAGIGHDHRGERLAERGLDGRFPTVLDAHEVEQRAEHAVHAGEVLGAGPGVGEVERHLQRLYPCRARGRGLGGLLPVVDGRVERRLGVDRALLGSLHLLDQRRLEQLGGRAVVPVLVAQLIELARRVSRQLVEARAAAPQLALDPLGRGQTRAQLAAHLGDRARRRRGRHRVERGETLLALGGERRLFGRELVGLGRRSFDRDRNLVELEPVAGRLGLERGDDALVEQLTAVALEAARALGDQRAESAGSLAQLVGAGEPIADVVGAAGTQLGARARRPRRRAGRARTSAASRRRPDWCFAAASDVSRVRRAAISRPATYIRSVPSSATSSP